MNMSMRIFRADVAVCHFESATVFCTRDRSTGIDLVGRTVNEYGGVDTIARY
jgi:hypothetical protein